ncbi:hypothetical protein [Treponema sp. R80B11-R83G3]
MEKIYQLIINWFQKLSAGQKSRLAIICTVVFAAVLTLSVFISLKTHGGEKKEKETKPQESVVSVPIPPEELFLPDEPDYVPGVLLERDKRANWTDEDASEYWQDPLKYGEEQWREKIETSIDEFMEQVP